MQQRLRDFNVTKDKKFTQISDSTLKLTFEKQLLVKFEYCIKEKFPQLSDKTIKMLFYFPTLYLCEIRFSSHISTKTMYHNRLNNELSMRIQLFY